MLRGLKRIVPSVVTDSISPDVVPFNPSENTPQSVGELLQIKRQECGLDLREVAEYLNIRYAYLSAIDEGRVDDLPGAAYAMGFVRAYADYLGLDGSAIVERYKDETAELGADVRLDFPSPLSEGKLPSGAIVLIGLFILVVAYGGWVVLAQNSVKFTELVPALAERFSEASGLGESVDSSPKPALVASKAVPGSIQDLQTSNMETIDPLNPGPAADSGSKTNEQSESHRRKAHTVKTLESAKILSDSAAVTETSTAQRLVNKVSRAVAGAAINGRATVNKQSLARRVSVEEQTVSLGSPVLSNIAPQHLSRAGQLQEFPALKTIPGVQKDVKKTLDADQTPEGSLFLPPKPSAREPVEPRYFGRENTDSRVLIKVRIDSWVQIQDLNGKKLLTQVLRAGDSYRVPNRPGLLLDTGNAGGLEITVDNERISDIGPKGAIRRGIALGADLLKSGVSR